MEKQLGNYSFIGGVIIALVLGLFANAEALSGAADWLWLILVVLGLAVGLLNVSGKETKDFLLVTVSLVVVAFAAKTQVDFWAGLKWIGPYLNGVFNALLAFVVPASVVVALKEVWELARGN